MEDITSENAVKLVKKFRDGIERNLSDDMESALWHRGRLLHYIGVVEGMHLAGLRDDKIVEISSPFIFSSIAYVPSTEKGRKLFLEQANLHRGMLEHYVNGDLVGYSNERRDYARLVIKSIDKVIEEVNKPLSS